MWQLWLAKTIHYFLKKNCSGFLCCGNVKTQSWQIWRMRQHPPPPPLSKNNTMHVTICTGNTMHLLPGIYWNCAPQGEPCWDEYQIYKEAPLEAVANKWKPTLTQQQLLLDHGEPGPVRLVLTAVLIRPLFRSIKYVLFCWKIYSIYIFICSSGWKLGSILFKTVPVKFFPHIDFHIKSL